jgi:high-affinity nickel permease
MLGLDDRLAHVSDGTTFLIVIAVALMLGLRHASDPDHLAAVTTLIASSRERASRLGATLGFSWGVGHATSLFIFGLPIILFRAYLSGAVLEAAETSIGLLIVALAACLLIRWWRGVFRLHPPEHASEWHAHLHGHLPQGEHEQHRHTLRARSPFQAYAIGFVHGIGGSAGVGVLLLATIRSQLMAAAALAVFAFFTAVSMALLSSGFGLVLSSGRVRASFHTVAPVLGLASLSFGVWYALGALSLAPYYL